MSLSKAEVRNVTALCEFPTDGMHFYCETADLTVPFPRCGPRLLQSTVKTLEKTSTKPPYQSRNQCSLSILHGWHTSAPGPGRARAKSRGDFT
eukprot:1187027-Prorocentrum_minimum.AAC.3